jgi:hypothetical protein
MNTNTKTNTITTMHPNPNPPANPLTNPPANPPTGTPPPVDPVEALLREHQLTLDDGGFTARVMSHLPRRRRAWRAGAWWWRAVLLATVGAGSLLAGRWLPWERLARPPTLPTLVADPDARLAWITAVLLIASLVWGVIAALEPEGE